RPRPGDLLRPGRPRPLPAGRRGRDRARGTGPAAARPGPQGASEAEGCPEADEAIRTAGGQHMKRPVLAALLALGAVAAIPPPGHPPPPWAPLLFSPAAALRPTFTMWPAVAAYQCEVRCAGAPCCTAITWIDRQMLSRLKGSFSPLSPTSDLPAPPRPP